MATTPSLLSVEEYLHTSYSPDTDFIDGELQERHVGEYEHGKIQSFLAHLFTAHEDDWRTDAVVEQRIRVAPDRVRICDLAVLRTDAPHEHVVSTPPLICIEVLSPEDRIGRAEEVLRDYRAMGVPHLWLIDPLRRSAFTFDHEGLHTADVRNLVVADTPIRVDLSEIFMKLDAKAKQGKRV